MTSWTLPLMLSGGAITGIVLAVIGLLLLANLLQPWILSAPSTQADAPTFLPRVRISQGPE